VTAHRIFDQPECRLEGEAKVTGRALFAADRRHGAALEVAFLRSPFPHALLRSIDTTAARDMRGVRAVLTGLDTAPARLGRRLMDWPVLAWDRVRMVGDRIAAVGADTRDQAESAVRAIRVAYEELPAVFDPEDALAASAPVLHPDAAAYRYLDGTRPAHPHPNIQGRVVREHGDVDAAFASAAHVFTHEFEIPRTFQGYLEPRASMVWMEGDDYHVVSTNKSPFILRWQMSAGLDIPLERLVIDAGYIGGDFGGKGLSADEYVLTFLARLTGRPVRAVSTYTDDMSTTNTRHGARIRLRTATDSDGRFVAHEGRVLFDGGAYAAAKPNMFLIPGEGLTTLAAYDVPNARVEALAVYTNTVPAGQARAPGQVQNAFAAESHVDLIARALSIDPLQLRMRNAIRPGGRDVLGERWKQSTMIPVLETLCRQPQWSRPLTAHRGRGIAVGCRPSPAGQLRATVTLEVRPDSSVRVLTGVPDQGGGAHTMLQRVVAQALGIGLEQVSVFRGTTAEASFDLGAGGSRVTPVVGGAALAGATALLDCLEELAPGLSISGQLDRAALDGLRVLGEFEHAGGEYCTYAYLAEVEVDPETGDFCITDCVLVADVGTVINPLALRGQLMGGFVTGVGQATMEEIRVRDGVVTTSNLDTYSIPTMSDVPPLHIVLITDDKGDGPFGAKSVGELSNPAIAPAIANAVADAVGARITSLPITAEKIFVALQDG
jgi:CO/xanthine dehydrogenase Mo-binding subunit